ncbi:MAG: 4Fe-4S dicluster domain-containing protein [Candidatus Aminicenantes bacterium]|nr:4Fe-4S dicluster domain-containing protein [Candidatus Aminicenantes bacterium]
MSIYIIAGGVSLIILIFFFFLFALYSLLEKEKRALGRSSIVFFLLIIIGLIFYLAEYTLKNWLFGITFVLLFLYLAILLFSPLKRKSTEIVGDQKKVDERDVIFTRFEYEEGTETYEEYYSRRPEYKKIDDEIRKIPDILSLPHLKKNPILNSLASAEFDFLEHQITQVSGKENKEKSQLSPSENTRIIKEIIKYLGSDLCGISSLDQTYVYSHVGRGPEHYGEEINLEHKYAIAFALEMDLGMVAAAPKEPVIVETGKKYVEAARISIIVADFIRRLGYPARAHIAGSNYQAMLPPLAWLAGLGELGRLGILITSKYGPRARLGLVTTDLPLVVDRSRKLGIQNFCQKCQKCARNCPAQAIPYEEKTEENGVMKWVLNREECYKFWRKAGTDCAVCIYVCPYSKSDNAFHGLIRKMTENSSAAQSFSIWADDLFYGRIPLRRKSPLR